MSRWTWTDLTTTDTWVMPYNPKAAKFPIVTATVEALTSAVQPRPRGRRRVSLGEMTFSGTTTTEVQHDTVRDWFHRRVLMELVDHLGTTWTLKVTRCDQVPKRALGKTWRHTYEVAALVLSKEEAP